MQHFSCDRCGGPLDVEDREQVMVRGQTYDLCEACGDKITDGWASPVPRRDEANAILVPSSRGRRSVRPPVHGHTAEAIEASQHGGVKAPEPA